jgi:hypothetical protein
MPFVKANPNQRLLTGRGGRLVDRGAAVQTYLLPGTVYILIPADKQEAAFEFTQESRDGIPLRFKGIVVYRVSDPVTAAGRFNFVKPGLGTAQVNELLTHVVLGELRHAVSHMTMIECIEQRKTTLSAVVETALADTIHREGSDWGITVEVAQLAQVFITDPALRAQLEAERRNEIKLAAERSEIATAEEARLAAMASAERLAARKLADDREQLRRGEALFAAQMAAEEARVTAETPVRLLRSEREREALEQEALTAEVAARLEALSVERAQLAKRAEADLRERLLPLEQAPQIVEAAARLFAGSQLSLYSGADAGLLAAMAPLLEAVARATSRATVPPAAPGG